jgi:DNA polymerase-3 subunit gamma/tau
VAAPRPAAPPKPIPARSVAPQATAPASRGAADDWHTISAQLNLGGMVRSLAQHCELVDVGAEAVNLRLPPAHKYLLAKAHQDKLQAELQTYFGRPLRLNIVLADTATETPVERSRVVQRERQERAIEAIEQDGFVRDVVDLFDATINESSIKPL